VFAPLKFDRFLTALASPRGWIELAIIAACVLIAWLLDRRLERARKRWSSRADVDGAASPGFAYAFLPLCALVLLFIAQIFYRHFARPVFIEIAIPLLIALTVMRLLVYALRRLFPTQAWLSPWEVVIGSLVFGLLVLYYTGVLADIGSDLDAMEIPIGKTHVSVLAMGKGVMTVVITVVVTLWLSGLIEQRLMKSAPKEGNLPVVLARFVRALLLLAAILLSLQAVGIDLTVLSVFGGALGVGIGLGLQKLASNYIAGFTILMDRSIRIGDLVTVDNRYGMVAKVTARYVLVRSLDGVEAIIPNETLVTTTVLNHSYTDKDLRVGVPVQVSYDADVEQALALMEAAARSEARVLATPGPRAFVVRFAESGIDLELGVWINDPEAGHGDLRSNLNLKILAAFRAHGIGIPFPQREVRLVAAPTQIPATTLRPAPPGPV
jgi:small-conductance mechanosensitive channel